MSVGIMMAKDLDVTHDQLIDRLAEGFEALMRQVRQLERHRAEVEKMTSVEQVTTPEVSRPNDYDSNDDYEAKIRQGVEALKLLRKEKRDIPQGNSDSHLSQESGHNTSLELPDGHPQVMRSTPQDAICPFASMTNSRAKDKPDVASSQPKHRDNGPGTLPSPPPSLSGSMNKCPIRLLDTCSPEEIAAYFETHKHEIPRSHEVCVKRYQTNEQSIRALDAKYGDLVHMIQGLGNKHRCFMREEHQGQDLGERRESLEGGGQQEGQIEGRDMQNKKGGIADWAGKVSSPVILEAVDDAVYDNTSKTAKKDERENNFDRPLKEIRVGESPSRPWGISVPAAADTVSDYEDGAEEGPKDRSGSTQREIPIPPLRDTPRVRVSNKRETNDDKKGEERPPFIFTGPVFIGYPPDQVALLLKESGIS